MIFIFDNSINYDYENNNSDNKKNAYQRLCQINRDHQMTVIIILRVLQEFFLFWSINST